MAKSKKNKRARAQRRRMIRAAERRARPQRAATGTPPAMSHFVGGFGGGPDGLYDDCPMCRAMRHAGIVPDPLLGAAIATPEQQRMYEEKLAEIVAAEGMPEGAVTLDGEDFLVRHVMATVAMTAEGWPDEPWDLPATDRSAFFDRYNQLVRGDVDVSATN
jgi:hypothetical protein